MPYCWATGTARFSRPQYFRRGTTRFRSAGDFNADDKPDLAVVNSHEDSVGIFLGNGDGTFGPQTTFPTGTRPRHLSVADLNHDHALDLLVVLDFASVSVLSGNGDGTFQPPATYTVGAFGPPAIADLNDDADPDLIVANVDDDDISILLGNGDGTFQPPVRFDVGQEPSALVIADLNNDGHNDITVANRADDNVAVLLNQCNADPPGPRVIYVNPDSVLPHDGLSWQTAFEYLQDALAVARPGDQVWLTAGIHKPDQGARQTAGNRQASFVISAGIPVYGGFAGTETSPDERDPNAGETILSGDLLGDDGPNFGNRADNTGHVVTIDTLDQDVLLDRLTIADGNARPTGQFTEQLLGGGVFVRAEPASTVSITLRGCTLRKNRAVGSSLTTSSGGAIFVEDLHLALIDCTIDNNRADEGGAITVRGEASLVVTGSAFANNTATQLNGGAILVDGDQASLSATGTTFSNNVALEWEGGAVHLPRNRPEQMVFDNCLFADNEGGGAVSGDATFAACVFERNYGTALYGQVLCTGCTFRANVGGAFYGGGLFRACVFEDNHSAGGGGAGLVTSPYVLRAEDCVFLRNTAGDPNDAFADFGGALLLDTFAQEPIVILRCRFEENRADRAGAIEAAHFPEPGLRIDNCTFIRNRAEEGAAVRVFNTPTTINNSIFVGNQADMFASAVQPLSRSRVLLNNSTITQNVAASAFGAAIDAFDAEVIASNCVAWNNQNANGTARDAQMRLLSSSPRRVVNCIVQGWDDVYPGANVLDADPLFVDPLGPDGMPGTGDEDFHLLPESPAIDAGWNNIVPRDGLDLDEDGDTDEFLPVDLDGNPRFQDDPNTPGGCGLPAAVDIGPYEFPGLVMGPPCIGDVDGDGVIGLADLTDLLVRFGTRPVDPLWHCLADLDADLDIDLNDLTLLLRRFGATCGT